MHRLGWSWKEAGRGTGAGAGCGVKSRTTRRIYCTQGVVMSPLLFESGDYPTQRGQIQQRNRVH